MTWLIFKNVIQPISLYIQRVRTNTKHSGQLGEKIKKIRGEGRQHNTQELSLLTHVGASCLSFEIDDSLQRGMGGHVPPMEHGMDDPIVCISCRIRARFCSGRKHIFKVKFMLKCMCWAIRTDKSFKRNVKQFYEYIRHTLIGLSLGCGVPGQHDLTYRA